RRVKCISVVNKSKTQSQDELFLYIVRITELQKMTLQTNTRRARGLAAMSPERRREIARMGGRTSQARGTAHQWTAEEASAAGKKGSARYALKKVEESRFTQ